MKKTLSFIFSAVLALLLTACSNNLPQQIDYKEFKASKPRSILILPPTNQTAEIIATPSVFSTSAVPLAEAGYYVFPVTLVNETLKQNGITVAGQAHEIPYTKLHDIFGADSVLYIDVHKYGSSYKILSSVIEVSLNARLIDLRTGNELWKGKVAIEHSGNNNSGGGLIGMLVSAAVNQIINDLADSSYNVAKIASYRLVSPGHYNGLLYGPYHPLYNLEPNTN